MDYDLGELDVALSAAAHQAADVRGPPNDPCGGTRTPGTRRGSLVPVGVGALPASTRKASVKTAADDDEKKTTRKHRKSKARHAPQPELDLFTFDLREQVQDVLLTHGQSRVSYHEYAVFSPPADDPNGAVRSPSIMAEGDDGLQRFHEAISDGHGLDVNGGFSKNPKGSELLRGRVRQVIAHRRLQYGGAFALDAHTPDGLVLTADDYNTLGLHSATLPSIQRVTVESHFWDAKRNTIYLILSFSNNPQPPYDFLSMTYKLKTRTTTALIRRSFDARWHHDDALDEYERRLDSSRSRWSHPLVLPIVLLQVQLYRTEEAVIANNGEVLLLEAHVDGITGTTGQANAEAFRRNQQAQAKAQAKAQRMGHNSPGPLRRLSTFKDMIGEKISRRSESHSHPHRPDPINTSAPPYGPGHLNGFGYGGMSTNASARMDMPLTSDYVPPQTIHLMKEAHEVLKGAIQLLDTLRWMERAVKLIIQVGDELDLRLKEIKKENMSRGMKRATGGRAENEEMSHSDATSPESNQDDESDSDEEDDEEEDLIQHWHEMRQYLDCTWRLCTSLETDRRMSELRCRAQIDIIYSKMAQEDNNLNARMAVASTRDSSSMKALAVITAIFLPGEYIGTLFGLSMFNWARGTAGDPAESDDANKFLPKFTVMPTFWIYWAFTIPLTLFIVTTWRAWWISQDRFFRRHLSTELSNERYWTVDGQPRELETTFLEDFFSILDISGARSTSNSAIVGEKGSGSWNNGATSSALSPGLGFELSRTRSKEKDMRPGGLGLLQRTWTSSLNTSNTVGPPGSGGPGGTFRGGQGPPSISIGQPGGRNDGLSPYDSKAMTGTTDDDACSVAMPLPTTPRRFRTVSFATQDNRVQQDHSAV
ncbi:uncharacterized protein B0I36DRAFT_367714 [Microdochium trichocladiopsis]|uniref:Uncharacterized protein n=1 Tax=Microdochium trichocladiopsis TaxID=1682393 RepID=A0A9P8XZB4_9PEZI|nr:uncharacterized protein B0I36DRAFT_367714 [Microdochium trichocladiopsis]KAH7021294.1 hypothetical protein B0I36DRAFT_367714 [Microdochium trichocladiopsis]